MSADEKPTVPRRAPGTGRSDRLPVGWWIVPGAILGLAIWIALIRIALAAVFGATP